MDEVFDGVGLWEDQRRLAMAMLEGFAAGAFEKAHKPADVERWEAVLAAVTAKIEGIGQS